MKVAVNCLSFTVIGVYSGGPITSRTDWGPQTRYDFYQLL